MLFVTKHPRLFWLFLGVWLAALYAPAVSGPFVLDDLHTIFENEFVHHWSGLWIGWTSGAFYSALPSNYGYRPVTVTVTTALWLLGGGSTWVFHLFKISLMWATCRALFRLWQDLFAEKVDALVFYAAILIFAINPVHTQVVSYMSAVSTQLAAFFGLVSVIFYVRFFQRHHVVDLLACLGFLALATLSKEEGVATLAFVIAVDGYLRLNGRRGPAWRNLSAVVACALACVWLIFHMYEPSQGLVRTDVTRSAYFLTQTRAWVRYVVMAMFPYDLNFDNLEFGFSFSFGDARVLFSLACSAFLVAFAVWQIRGRPWIALAVLWFYAGLSPASSFVVLAEPVNDHRAFLGYLGLSFFIVFGFAGLNQRWPKSFGTIVVILLCVYSGLTFQRSFFWRTTESVWTETARKNPSSPRAKNNLALEYITQKRFSDALIVLNGCIEQGANYANCFLNRGVAHVGLGQEVEALGDFETGARLDPIVSSSHLILARYLIARGFFARPRELLEKADLFTRGKDLDVRLSLIDLLTTNGFVPEAKRLVEESRPRFSSIEKFETRVRLLDTL